MKKLTFLLLFFTGNACCNTSMAQMVTGYWKGKIDGKKVEVKIIKNGDSIAGTSYYYESSGNYRRYTIKGYVDGRDNSVVWWDDVLIEEKGNKKGKTGKKEMYISSADFNCPGGTKMYLTGNAAAKEEEGKNDASVTLEKYNTSLFTDEWNDIIDNYTLGANDPRWIDSVSRIALQQPQPVTASPEVQTVSLAKPPPALPVPVTKKEVPPLPPPPVKEKVTAPLNNEEKFNTRSRRLMQEIFITGDSVELRFYDNAEVDGDSIAIFLNNKLLYEHVRLSDKPFIITLPVAGMQPENELVMVAENLGSIPPNTSLMVAVIDGKHYEARLESTEQSSALIKFVKR